MIRFALACANDHRFEGWFGDSAAFASQKAAGVLACPICGTAAVDKALMAPAVATARSDATPVAAHVPDHAEAVAMLRQIKKRLTDSADYVGPRFAEEARRIHYDEVEKRGIYGEASRDEVRSLADEGIEFHPLPVLPEDHN